MTSPLPPKSIAVVLGTRPEIVKLAGIIEILGEALLLIHTGQHYDANLSQAFLDELGVPAPTIHLGVGGKSRGEQLGSVIGALDAAFAELRPLAVVGQGDTNTTAGAAVAANAREIPLVHIEAGLRSYDRAMPEEHNRVIADHLADLCCAPTETSRGNLEREGIPSNRIVVTGNTVVEATRRLLPPPGARSAALIDLDLTANEFILGTFHRPENVDNADNLELILHELDALPLPVVIPMHPRTVARVEQFGLADALSGIRVVEPLPYSRFLGLAAESAMLISDSGGVQEECSILKRPTIVVRNSTERPEVLGSFAELVAPGPRIGEIATSWLADLPAKHAELAGLPSPYGDGSASRRSVDAILELLA